MKTIDKYKEDYYYYTGKASEINRSLALGGIAVIWIFKTTVIGNPIIPVPLITPLIWLVVALGLDLMQYIIGGLIWYAFYKYQESRVKAAIITPDSDIKAPGILPGIIHVFYWTKLISTLIAYCYLLSFLYSKII